MLDLYMNIKKRRNELGMTQTDLAKKMGYADKSMIAKIEKGLVDLSQSRIVAFAEALSTTPAALMGWNESESAERFNNVPLSKREHSHILIYRDLSDQGKDRVDEYTEKTRDLEKQDEDSKIVESFQKRFVARNGNKNMTPDQMKKIMDILDGENKHV